MSEEEICRFCSDLLNEEGECYGCSPSTVELHKDFVFEYAFESLCLRDTLFRPNQPDY